MDQGLNQKIDAYIAENKEQLLQDIAALVAIDSVEGTPEEGAPFGKGPRAALDKTLELAAGMGLATRNCENYMGYAELAGADPEKYLATICHVDVVPVGNGWTADPFKMRIQDGWLLGRGVSDDKGPMVVALYALKFLKEQGYELRYPIRALIGDNEETHMQDVEYYLKNYPAPVFCFTPDAEFLNNTSPAGLRILSSSTCVGLRYGPLLHDSGFSRQEGAAASLLCFAPHHAFVLCRTDFPILRLLRLHRAFHSRLCFPSRVPAVLITRGAGIFYLLSIGYASLPLLRPRLTQSRSALLWKPWIFGRKDSHLALATHSGILSS